MTNPPLDALHGGAPFWLIRNGLGHEPGSVREREVCDVLVVGGGVTGALVADTLTSAGLEVILIDARIPGIGSTAASSALLLYELDVELLELSEKIGVERAGTAYRQSFAALDALEKTAASLDVACCDFGPRQSLYLARTRREVGRIRVEAAARHAAGFECQVWDREALRERAGIHAAGAIFTPHAAAVDALRLTRALIARARAGGARVYGRTSLQAIESVGRVFASTTGGLIDARFVVLATGYEVPPCLTAPTVRVHSTFAFVTEPWDRAAGLAPFVVWESARPYCYVRVTDDRRILIGGADLPFRNASARDAALPARIKRLTRRLAEMLGEPPPPIAFAWAGAFAETTDGLPLIGPHPTLPNVFVALAYGGNGITFGALAAAILDRQIRGEPDPRARLFAPERAA